MFEIQDGILTKYIEEQVSTEIVIPEGIVSIGPNVFVKNENITKVVIPEGVKEISDYAFTFCSNLKEVNFPDSLMTIGNRAFAGTALRKINITGDTSLAFQTFQGCVQLESVSLQALKELGEWTFLDCPSLEIVSLSDSIQIIGEGCFADCKKLTNIELPKSLVSVGANAFRGCALKKIIIPTGVMTFGKSPFLRCNKIKTAGPIGSGCDYEFYWKETIPKYAFSGLKNLETVQLPDSIVKIGISAFADCKNLTTVNISSDVKIDKNAFKGCISLSMESERTSDKNQHFTIVDGVLSAFSGTEINIRIPEGVTKIASRAFYSIPTIESVVIPASVETIEREAFENTGLKHLEILGIPVKIGQNAFGNPFFYKNTPLIMDLVRRVPLNAFNNNNRHDMFIAFIKNSDDPEINSTVAEKNWEYISKHLKEFEYNLFQKEEFGVMFRRLLMERKLIRKRDFDWILQETNQLGMVELSAQLLEYQNRRDEKI